MSKTIELTPTALAELALIQQRTGRSAASIVEEGLHAVLMSLDVPASDHGCRVEPFDMGPMSPEFAGNWDRVRREIYGA